MRSQSTAILECEVEAFPEPTVHWERVDGRRLKMSDKYRMEIYERRDYKVVLIKMIIIYKRESKRDGFLFQFKMRLKILRVLSNDHGTYHCVVKNDIDVTKGSLIIDGRFNISVFIYLLI